MSSWFELLLRLRSDSARRSAWLRVVQAFEVASQMPDGKTAGAEILPHSLILQSSIPMAGRWLPIKDQSFFTAHFKRNSYVGPRLYKL